MDQAFSALVEDLSQRGLLDETLVVCVAEFGQTLRLNGRGGRGHWGHVFSVPLPGGGIQGGRGYGSADKQGGQPRNDHVSPQDLTATILDRLGFAPHTEIRDLRGRRFVISKGTVIRGII
jgi:uncharacterized protein (DUF1501 family)